MSSLLKESNLVFKSKMDNNYTSKRYLVDKVVNLVLNAEDEIEAFAYERLGLTVKARMDGGKIVIRSADDVSALVESLEFITGLEVVVE